MIEPSERPLLDRTLDSDTFQSFYWLKEELMHFCRENELPTSGAKQEITQRIARYLENGEVQKPTAKSHTTNKIQKITEDMLIEENLRCSEVHRAFFKEQVGKSFSFNVAFQKWLKENSGKTYRDAVVAYGEILENKKKKKSTIEKQFEYNTYIRDFFADNKGCSLEDAIRCWKYKKQKKGHNRYEKEDLINEHNSKTL